MKHFEIQPAYSGLFDLFYEGDYVLTGSIRQLRRYARELWQEIYPRRRMIPLAPKGQKVAL
jgi:hypothetical protein